MGKCNRYGQASTCIWRGEHYLKIQLVRDIANNRKAEASATDMGVLAAVKAIKDTVAFGDWYARAAIANRE